MGHHGNLFTSFGVTGAVGGWKFLAKTTLGSAGQKILITGIADKRYLMILTNMLPNGINDLSCNVRFNEDAGGNYARRDSFDGAADGTTTSITATATTGGISIDNQVLGVHYVSNLSAKEKLLLGGYNLSNATGAGTVSNRGETVGKWANTSAVIDDVEQVTGDLGFGTGSEVVVLGWDPADTHTTNFWEELASADLSGGSADTISSGVFTSKKYLWIQCFTGNTGGATRASLRVGKTTIDTGNNYAYRRSVNGAGDEIFASSDRMAASSGAVADTEFHNFFIVNNSANEKLMTGIAVRRSTAGAGFAPTRHEFAGKWTNTSNQIDIVQLFNDQAGSFGTNTILKVWGSN